MKVSFVLEPFFLRVDYHKLNLVFRNAALVRWKMTYSSDILRISVMSWRGMMKMEGLGILMEMIGWNSLM